MELDNEPLADSTDAVFRKAYADHEFANELAKALAMQDAAVASHFRVPSVVECDDIKNKIHYEYVSNMVPLRVWFLNALRGKLERTQAEEIFVKVGACLAEMHKRLVLRSYTNWIAPQVMKTAYYRWYGRELERDLDSTERIILHCDFGFTNVQLVENDLSIVFIDPSPNKFTTFRCDVRGSYLIDFAHMLSCMDGLVRTKDYFQLDWKLAEQLKKALRDNYEKELGIKVDMDLAQRISRLISFCYLKKRFGGGLRLKLAMGLVYGKNFKKY